eukprot:1144025-Amphidinium_carterae.1
MQAQCNKHPNKQYFGSCNVSGQDCAILVLLLHASGSTRRRISKTYTGKDVSQDVLQLLLN